MINDYLRSDTGISKTLAVTVVLFSIFLSGYMLFPAQHGLRLIEPSAPFASAGKVNGTWSVAKNLDAKNQNVFVENVISIDEHRITINEFNCQRISVEEVDAVSFINKFKLQGKLNKGDNEAKFWTTNCNDAGNVFIKSEGVQGFVILNNKYFFVLYLKNEKHHLFQLVPKE